MMSVLLYVLLLLPVAKCSIEERDNDAMTSNGAWGADGKVCIDERLGCLSRTYLSDDNRDEPYPPQFPKVLGTAFYLHTKTSQQNISNFENPELVKTFDVQPNKPVIFIIHGFTASGNSDWVKKMTHHILATLNATVIVVDWTKGAAKQYFSSYKSYKQAAANAWVVGGQLSLLCDALHQHLEIEYAAMHLIGHSLGCHVAGFAGLRLNGQLGRITALDPAEPEFQNTAKHIRIDALDAKFVDIIHTDGNAFFFVGGYGMMQAVGHVDIFPNGGESQPGCFSKRSADSDSSVSKRGGPSCDHGRAHEYYTESLSSSCPFIAHQCESYEAYKAGKCTSCGQDGSLCVKMGYYAHEYKNPPESVNKKFYLTTSRQQPFCLYHYALVIQFEKPVKFGYLSFNLHGFVGTHNLTAKVRKEDKEVRVFIEFGYQFGPVKKVEMTCLAEWGLRRYDLCKANDLVITKLVVEQLDILPELKRIAESPSLCLAKNEAIKPDTRYEFKDTNC